MVADLLHASCNLYATSLLRSAIDLKRHYNKGDSKSKTLLKSGMVIVSTSYFFTVRLMRKERKGTIAAELLSDHALADYSKGEKKSSIPMCPIWVHFIYRREGIEEKQGLQWQRNAS
uniref:Fcf2 pre-rRNA processing C-terminal domain-containing protein n=1 Tax=Quercus lobata TaxID=97700 RepID=A0A7N2N1T4_QUELO